MTFPFVAPGFLFSGAKLAGFVSGSVSLEPRRKASEREGSAAAWGSWGKKRGNHFETPSKTPTKMWISPTKSFISVCMWIRFVWYLILYKIHRVLTHVYWCVSNTFYKHSGFIAPSKPSNCVWFILWSPFFPVAITPYIWNIPPNPNPNPISPAASLVSTAPPGCQPFCTSFVQNIPLFCCREVRFRPPQQKIE